MANCAHGFPVGQCLICSTLEGPAQRRRIAKVAVAEGGSHVPGPSAPRTTDMAVVNASTGHWGLKALGLVVVGIVAVWLLGSLFSLAAHLVELGLVALVAAWAGYHLGRRRGRRAG